MTGTDLHKRTHKSVPVIFEPPCINTSPWMIPYTLLQHIGLAVLKASAEWQ